MKNIDIGKEYITVGGLAVRNMQIDADDNDYPVCGQVCDPDGMWITRTWTREGVHSLLEASHGHYNLYDLVEVTTAKKTPALDWTKPLQTASGKSVRLVGTLENHGQFTRMVETDDTVRFYTETGTTERSNPDGDVVNVPEEIVDYIWVNIDAGYGSIVGHAGGYVEIVPTLRRTRRGSMVTFELMKPDGTF